MEPSEITDEFVQSQIAKGKRYVLMFYNRGSAAPISEEEADRIQAGHLRCLFELRQSGKLVLNGPLVDDGDMRGIAIFDLTDIEEVKALVAEDPALKAGRLVPEFHPWFGLPGDRLPE